MGIFGKLKSGITFPFRKAGGAVLTQGDKMKRWFTSKTIGVAAMFLVAKLLGAVMVDVEVLAAIELYAPWSLPFLMVLLRIVTKGPITK